MSHLITTELLCQINKIADDISLATNGIVQFEEYVLLPYYRNIVLRFDLNLDEYTLDDLDEYESMICKIAGNEFLTDFMGNVYRKVGVSYDTLNDTLKTCAVDLKEEAITPSVHSDAILNITNQLQKLCGLSENEKIWEIQPDEEPVILLSAKEEGSRQSILVNGQCYHIGSVNEQCCEGLMRAVFRAKRTSCSLARILTEHS